MCLVLGKINIKGVEFAQDTKVENGILLINKDELIAHLKQ